MLKDKNYYESLDKRTKEYKEWKKGQEYFNNVSANIKNTIEDVVIINAPSKGLGDTVEKITKATGIKKVVKKVFGNDCGCDERKETLNKIFPYRKKAERCLTEEMYNRYKAYRERRTLNVWHDEDIQVIVDLYAWVFAIQYDARRLCRSCPGSGKILMEASKKLDVVFESYEK